MGRIATIGFFDGVHKGHRYLFKQLNEEAAARGLKPLIVTFEEHPRTVLQSDYIPKLLSTKEERKALLSAYGVLYVTPDKKRAVFFAYCISYDTRNSAPQFRLDGLSADKNYRIAEVNVDKSSSWFSGKVLSGSMLNFPFPHKYLNC